MSNSARVQSLTAHLAKSRVGLLTAADTVSLESWKTAPSEGRWSSAELIAHLTQVERSVIAQADRILQHPPKRVPALKRFHLPMALVESRLVRRKAPMPITPELLRDKEQMLADLRAVRERTQAFLEETSNRDLSEYYWPHPALGMLNIYGWIRFLASHEIRHTKQMREISGSLRKVRMR